MKNNDKPTVHLYQKGERAEITEDFIKSNDSLVQKIHELQKYVSRNLEEIQKENNNIKSGKSYILSAMGYMFKLQIKSDLILHLAENKFKSVGDINKDVIETIMIRSFTHILSPIVNEVLDEIEKKEFDIDEVLDFLKKKGE